VVAAATTASVVAMASARTCHTPQVVASHGEPGRTGPSSPHSGRDYIEPEEGGGLHRWATPDDAGSIQRFEKEPVALQPDLTADDLGAASPRSGNTVIRAAKAVEFSMINRPISGTIMTGIEFGNGRTDNELR
jgi:hypothetical protein